MSSLWDKDIDFSRLSSYPKPPSFLPGRPPFPTRSLFPVYPPPSSLITPPPALPSPQRSISPSSPFTVSTHIVPAAWLRSTPYVPLPSAKGESAAKEERKKAAKDTLDFLNKVRDETASSRPEEGHKWVLWNAVNRYVKKEPVNPNGLTLFFVHANGFNKEVFLFSPYARDNHLHEYGRYGKQCCTRSSTPRRAILLKYGRSRQFRQETRRC